MPRPRHPWQGVPIDWPAPEQAGHTCENEKGPWFTATCPDPPQVAHRSTGVPGSAATPRSTMPAMVLGILVLLASSSIAGAAEPTEPTGSPEAGGPRCYLIGNSLTWDTAPNRMGDRVQWHVDCGVPLTAIFANPDKPCVKESRVWPAALRDERDVIRTRVAEMLQQLEAI